MVVRGQAKRGHAAEFGDVPGLHFLEDVGAVVLDGAKADPQLPSDLLAGHSLSRQYQDLALPGAELIEIRMDLARFGLLGATPAIFQKRVAHISDEGFVRHRFFEEINRPKVDPMVKTKILEV